MKRLRLKRLGSYEGYGLKATRAQPFVDVDDELARVLVGKGYFEEVEELAGAAEAPGPEPALEQETGALESEPEPALEQETGALESEPEPAPKPDTGAITTEDVPTKRDGAKKR